MYLVDTNVLSERRKARPNPQLLEWITGTRDTEIFISVVSFGEIITGIERLRHRGDVGQADMLTAWISQLSAAYEARILPVTIEIAGEWGRMQVPDRIPPADGLIAATARYHGLTVVTGNVKDFARTGVPVLDPFAPR